MFHPELRGAGSPTHGQGRQTFFVDVERQRAQNSTQRFQAPQLPGSAKQWQLIGKTPAKSPMTKAQSSQLPGHRAGPHPQYAGKDDPLSLKEPPQGGGPGFDLSLTTDYLAADVNPDSLLADVEALLSQERMLTEQTKWWQDRARREQTAKESLQASMQTDQATCKHEVSEIQRRIDKCREEQRHESHRREGLSREAAELHEEARHAQHESDELRHKLEEIASMSSPQNARKIKAAIHEALYATQAPASRGIRTSMRASQKLPSDQASGSPAVSMPNSARSGSRARSASPRAITPRLDSARSGTSGKASPRTAQIAPAAPPPARQTMTMGFDDDDDDMDFGGGGGSNFGGGGGGFGGAGDPRQSALGGPPIRGSNFGGPGGAGDPRQSALGGPPIRGSNFGGGPPIRGSNFGGGGGGLGGFGGGGGDGGMGGLMGLDEGDDDDLDGMFG